MAENEGGVAAPQPETGEQSGQQQQQDWRSAVPAELRDAPALKDVRDVGSLAKQFIDQQKFLGNSIRIPGDDAGETGKNEFYEKLKKHAPNLITRPDASNPEAMADFWAMAGVPKDVDGYSVPDGVNVDADWLTGARDTAKRYGITNEVFQKFVADRVSMESAEQEKTTKTLADDAKALALEWGHATEGRLADVKKFADVMQLPDDFRTALAEGKVGSEWIKALHGIITQFGGMSEGKQVAFQPGGAIPDSPQELTAQVKEIEGNPAFLNQRAPQHNGLVQKRFELIQKINEAREQN